MIHFSFTHVYCRVFTLYGMSLTSFLPGDMSPIIVLELRRSPFTFRRFLIRMGSIIILIILPQPSSIRNPMAAMIIPSVDACIKHNAAYQKRDQRSISHHFSSVFHMLRERRCRKTNTTLYIVIQIYISLSFFY